MCVYNGARYLDESVASIREQTLRDIEILIVDDGSTDETPAMLARYAVEDPRIRLLHADHQGPASARNVGLAQARGRLVALMDADDIARPDRLALQLAFLRQNPDVVALGCISVAHRSARSAPQRLGCGASLARGTRADASGARGGLPHHPDGHAPSRHPAGGRRLPPRHGAGRGHRHVDTAGRGPYRALPARAPPAIPHPRTQHLDQSVLRADASLRPRPGERRVAATPAGPS